MSLTELIGVLKEAQAIDRPELHTPILQHMNPADAIPFDRTYFSPTSPPILLWSSPIFIQPDPPVTSTSCDEPSLTQLVRPKPTRIFLRDPLFQPPNTTRLSTPPPSPPHSTTDCEEPLNLIVTHSPLDLSPYRPMNRPVSPRHDVGTQTPRYYTVQYRPRMQDAITQTIPLIPSHPEPEAVPLPDQLHYEELVSEACQDEPSSDAPPWNDSLSATINHVATSIDILPTFRPTNERAKQHKRHIKTTRTPGRPTERRRTT